MKNRYKIGIILFLISISTFFFFTSFINNESKIEAEKSVALDIESDIKTPLDSEIAVNQKSNDYQEYELPFSQIGTPILEEPNILIFSTIYAHTSELLRYNLSSGKTETIFHSQYDEGIIQRVGANQNWLIWKDSSSDGAENKIYTMNKESNEINVISHSNKDFITADAPMLFDNYVAWIYLDNEDGVPQAVLKLHNLDTQTEKIIANINEYGLHNNFVHIEDGVITWTDRSEEQGFYYTYNLDSEKTTKYPSPFSYPAYAKKSGNKIFALHFEDLSRWGSHEFGYFDIKQKKYVPLNKNSNKSVDYFELSHSNLTIIESTGEAKNYSLDEKGVHLNDALRLPTSGYNGMNYSLDGRMIFSYQKEKDFSQKISRILITN